MNNLINFKKKKKEKDNIEQHNFSRPSFFGGTYLCNSSDPCFGQQLKPNLQIFPLMQKEHY